MSHRTRIYDPNGEPFDVPSDRVSDLVLQHGWSQTAPDADAVPAVTTVAPTPTPTEDGDGEGWRNGRGRRAAKAQEPTEEVEPEDGEAAEEEPPAEDA